MSRRDPLAGIDTLATLRAGRDHAPTQPKQPEPSEPTVKKPRTQQPRSKAPRPKAKPESESTKRVNLTLDSEVYDGVRALAFEQRSTVPDVIRAAVAAHLRRRSGGNG